MKCFLTFISLFFCTLVFAQPSKEEILKHHISKVTQKRMVGDAVYTQVYWYDRKGNDSAKLAYDKKTTIKNSYKNGKLVSMIYTTENGKEDNKYEYAYNADGSYKITETDGSFGMKSYEWYNTKNKIIKSQSPDGNTITYKYDAKNRLINVSSDGKNEGIKIKRQHFYDGKGQLIKTNNEQDRDKTIIVYTYDTKGKLIKESETGSWLEEPVTIVTEYQYNDKGLLEKMVEKRKPKSEEESLTTVVYEYEYL